MKYVVTVGGKAFEVVLNGGSVSVDGRDIQAELTAIPQTPLRELVIDGRSRTYAMQAEPGGWSLTSGGEAVQLRVDDERTVRLGVLGGSAERGGSGGKVKAPMPGLVLRVEVSEGDQVEAGAGLVVLEAMKMENEIKSPIAGRVSTVNVNDGQAVDKGTVLLEVVAEG